MPGRSSQCWWSQGSTSANKDPLGLEGVRDQSALGDVAEIRHAVEQDLRYLAEIETRAGRLFPAGRIPDPQHTYPAEALGKGLDEQRLFVATQNKRVVGFAICRLLDGYLHLDEVSVHPDYARRGIGRQLVQRTIQHSIELGLPGVTLTTFSDLPWNGPFYETMGFVGYTPRRLPAALAALIAEEEGLGMTHRIAMIRENQ